MAPEGFGLLSATMAPEGFGLLSAITYIGALTIFLRSIRSFLPSELIEDYFNYYLELITRYFTKTLTMVIEEYNGLVINEIYEAADIYVGSKMVGSNMPPLTRKIKVSKPRKEEKISTTMDEGEEVFDVFNGVSFEWRLIHYKKDESGGNKTIILNNNAPRNSKSSNGTQKHFNLRFHKKHKQMVLDDYLPYILKEYKSIKEEKKTLKIFTVNFYREDEDDWLPIKLDHPANFDKLAMDSKLKKTIIDDLDRFVKRKDFYRRVGKAWKRGYLLYGPPGTGKSSLIAAMANYLNFDIYDLELSEIPNNSYLRSILLTTANRSILVIEDIDCTVDFENRQEKKKKAKKDDDDDDEKVTLSGFLNFIDGLWSSVGDERIIVFTTNHKEKLDPALLRPGRMDMHILLSYCTRCGFKTLVSNYLEIKEHHLFEKIECIIDEAEVTPAEVAEQLMKGDDPDIVLQELIQFLQQKKIEHDEAKEKATREAEEAEKRAKEKKEEEEKKKKQDQDDDTSSDSSSSSSSNSDSSSSSSSSNSDSSDVDE